MSRRQYIKILAFILAILLIATLSSVFAQEDEHLPLFTLHSDGPIIEHGRLGDWDSVYNDAGTVIYHDGQFHMLRNGLQSLANGGASIGYLTSDDGLNWTEVSEDPVMSTADVPYTTITAQVGSVLVEDDGTWVMYLHVLDTANFPYSGGSIGRATAPNPLGPWTPDPEPLLLPGNDGEWDDLQVSHARVMHTDDGYRMYYSAYSQRRTMAIGLAFSDDGITWEKYNDPASTEILYAESDPVLVATEEWEFSDLHHPSVVQTPDGWVMTYRTPGGSGNVGFEVGLGLATSEDGIQWTKYAGNPIFVPSDLPGGRWIWYSTLAYHDGTYFLYMEGSTQRQLGGITDVYATTYEGSLPPPTNQMQKMEHWTMEHWAMKLKIILLISVLIITLIPATSFSQDDSESIRFDIDVSTPMIERGALFDWDGRFTNPGAVLYHAGQFHMFRPGFREWGQDTGVGYMTSDDGLNWTEYSEDPIFTQSEVPFETVAMPTTAIVEDDGTWVLYFFLVPLTDEQPSGITRATADQPQGPWTMDTDVILSLGGDGEWDSMLMPSPQVLKTDDGYVMYFGGQWDDSGDTYIGMATSDDGISWTKYDDPSTTEAPFAESDPILMPDTNEGSWEYPTSIQAPRVVETPDGFVMLYSSFNGMRSGGFRGYGMAISQDGLNWERVLDEPVFSTQDSNGRDTWFPSLVYHDGTYYMYLSIDSPRGGTVIYGGTYSGSLFD